MELHSPEGVFPVEIRNVSETGLLFIGDTTLRKDARVGLYAMGSAVPGRIVRVDDWGGAVAFHKPITQAQVANLRQFRDNSALRGV